MREKLDEKIALAKNWHFLYWREAKKVSKNDDWDTCIWAKKGEAGVTAFRKLKNWSIYIEDAWELVEEIRNQEDKDGYCRWYFKLYDKAIPEMPWTADFWYRNGGYSQKSFRGEGKTAAEAICRAYLNVKSNNSNM